MKNYKEMEVWKESRTLVKMIYEATRKFPKEELFGLTAQSRDAVISQFANISEGFGRKYRKETLHFLSHARGSLYELDSEMIAGLDQDYFSHAIYDELLLQIQLVIRLVNGTITYFEKANLP